MTCFEPDALDFQISLRTCRVICPPSPAPRAGDSSGGRIYVHRMLAAIMNYSSWSDRWCKLPKRVSYADDTCTHLFGHPFNEHWVMKRSTPRIRYHTYVTPIGCLEALSADLK